MFFVVPNRKSVRIFGFFSTIFHFTGGNTLKKENSNSTGNQLPTKKKFSVTYQNIIMNMAIFTYLFTLQTSQVLVSDMWSKVDTIPKDVYDKILGISSIASCPDKARHTTQRETQKPEEVL